MNAALQKREHILLELLADDLRALHASARGLERDLSRLARGTDANDIAPLAGLIAQINCTSFAPIEELLSDAGVSAEPASESAPTVMSGVLAEAHHNANTAENRRLGQASAIAIMRRSVRYMELYCSSVADSAARLRLNVLAGHLRAWAREWIGLELNLNAIAARPQKTTQAIPTFAAA